jgi:hypothetical protein
VQISFCRKTTTNDETDISVNRKMALHAAFLQAIIKYGKNNQEGTVSYSFHAVYLADVLVSYSSYPAFSG